MSGIEADPPPIPARTGEFKARRRSSPGRTWALALAAGLISGFASWSIGEALHGRFRPVEAASTALANADMNVESVAAERAAESFEACVAYGSLGTLLGLMLGVAGGFARGSLRAAAAGAIVGALLGGGAAAGMSRLLLPVYFRLFDPDQGDLTLALLIQGGIWPIVGAAGGAAFGIGLGERGRTVGALLGGLLGALAGMLAYEIVGAGAFPFDRTSNPLSATWHTRLFARLAISMFASVGAVIGALNQLEQADSGDREAPGREDGPGGREGRRGPEIDEP